MDLRVLIVIGLCCIVNILPISKADSDENDSEEDGGHRTFSRRKGKKICASDLNTYKRSEFNRYPYGSLIAVVRRRCPTKEKCLRNMDSVEVCCSDGKTYLLCQLILQNQPNCVAIVSAGPCATDGVENEGEKESAESIESSPQDFEPTSAPEVPQTAIVVDSTLSATPVVTIRSTPKRLPYNTDIPETTMMNTDIVITNDSYDLSTVAPTTKKMCRESCPLAFDPVCGTDGVTYPSLCVLNALMCTSNPALDLDYRGQCNNFQVP